MKSLRFITAAALLTVAAGCDRDPGVETSESVTLGTPIAVGDHLVQLDETRDTVWAFTPVGGERLDQAAYEFEEDVFALYPMPDGRLLVLTAREPALYVVDLDEGTTSARVALGAGYDAVTISPDARFVLAHFRQGSSGTDDSVLFTANQVTVVDLAGAEPSASEFTLAGVQPSRFVYAPPLTFTDATVQHHFVVAIADNVVSLVDLTTDDEANRQRIIPLAEPGTSRRIVASGISFSPDDPTDPYDVTMYIVASGSPAVFEIDLLPADPATGRLIQPAINQISAAAAPTQIHAFEAGGRDKLLVTDSGASQLGVIDVATSSATIVRIDRLSSRAILWDAVESELVRPKALLWQPGQSIVYFADLTNIERQGSGAMRALPLGSAIESVELVEATGRRKAVVRYQGGGGLDVLDLDSRRAIAIPSRVQLAAFRFAGDWLFTVAPSTARLIAVDLVNDRPVEIEIVAPGLSLDLVGDAIVVRHSDPFGWLTAYSLADFGEGAFGEAYGYAIHRLFDRKH